MNISLPRDVTVMDLLNVDSIIQNHSIQKLILSEVGLSAHSITKYILDIFYDIIVIKVIDFTVRCYS